MGGGAVVTEDGDTPGRAYHFRQSWIRHKLKASPAQLRIMHVEGDSMAPTLLGGDAVLVDMTRQLPNPPGISVLDDGMGLVAKRLEHIPNCDPPAVRVISDHKLYPEYDRNADEIRIIGRSCSMVRRCVTGCPLLQLVLRHHEFGTSQCCQARAVSTPPLYSNVNDDSAAMISVSCPP